MSIASKMFSKAALEKLSTPEKLDQLIKVISLKSWLVLLTIALVISTALTWSFTGRIKTKLNAQGVLLGGDVYNVVSNTNGLLVDLAVSVGDVLAPGDVIGEVRQPELAQQIEDAKALLEEKKFELKQAQAFGTEGSKMQKIFIAQQRHSFEQQIAANKKTLQFQKHQLELEKGLLEKGLLTRTQVINTEQQIEVTENQIESLKAELARNSTQLVEVEANLQKQITLLKQSIAQEERNLENLNEKYSLNSTIKSLHGGEVIEILSSKGMVIGQGTPICKLKSEDGTEGKLKGILYIPAQDGKKIKEGMEAFVVPATVQPQEFGYIKARVTYVSEFPVSQQGMMISMNNGQIVQDLLAMGAPFEVYVEFEKDSTAYSGYKWTSAKGPELSINEGTSCSGKITVKEEAPIALVVPALKGLFDLY